MQMLDLGVDVDPYLVRCRVDASIPRRRAVVKRGVDEISGGASQIDSRGAGVLCGAAPRRGQQAPPQVYHTLARLSRKKCRLAPKWDSRGAGVRPPLKYTTPWPGCQGKSVDWHQNETGQFGPRCTPALPPLVYLGSGPLSSPFSGIPTSLRCCAPQGPAGPVCESAHGGARSPIFGKSQSETWYGFVRRGKFVGGNFC